MREVTIHPNWTYLVQSISQSGAPDNIDLKDTWFTPYLDEGPSKTPTHVPRVASENNKMWSYYCSFYNKYKKFQSLREHPSLKWWNFHFPREFEIHQIHQKFVSLNNNLTCPVGCHLTREQKGSNMHKMIDLESTHLRIYASLSSKPIQNMFFC